MSGPWTRTYATGTPRMQEWECPRPGCGKTTMAEVPPECPVHRVRMRPAK